MTVVELFEIGGDDRPVIEPHLLAESIRFTRPTRPPAGPSEAANCSIGKVAAHYIRQSPHLDVIFDYEQP
jgi:hypothetical protein